MDETESLYCVFAILVQTHQEVETNHVKDEIDVAGDKKNYRPSNKHLEYDCSIPSSLMSSIPMCCRLHHIDSII